MKKITNETIIESLEYALFKLMETTEFSLITIKNLTKQASVGRVSFYRNFSSKEDIITKYLLKRQKEWEKTLEGKESYDIVEEVFNYLTNLRREIKLLYKNNLSHLMLESIYDLCGPKKFQPNIVAYQNAFIAGGLYMWCDEWVKRGMKESPKEMSKEFRKYSKELLSGM